MLKVDLPLNLIERFLRGERVYDGKLLQVYRDVVALPNGSEEVREVIRHPGAAVVAPRLADGRIVMVRQFRYALNRETLEFPAGRLDVGEEPLLCAQRELAEETGYRSATWRLLMRLHPAPGYTDELLWIYLAEDLIPGAAHPDPDELLMVELLSLPETFVRLQRGEISDAKTAATLLYLKGGEC